jgi:uncharacterized protein YutE (UPF0331/DUF86 family)
MAIDRPTLESLLEKLHEYVRRIESMEFSQHELETHIDIQDLLTHRLHTAVEVCIDIAGHLAAGLELPGRQAALDVFELLAANTVISPETAGKMRQARGARNILVHEYADVDYNLIFKTYPEDVDDLKQFAQEIISFLKKSNN